MWVLYVVLTLNSSPLEQKIYFDTEFRCNKALDEVLKQHPTSQVECYYKEVAISKGE